MRDGLLEEIARATQAFESSRLSALELKCAGPPNRCALTDAEKIGNPRASAELDQLLRTWPTVWAAYAPMLGFTAQNYHRQP